jgi:hypothetical protein
MLTAQLILACSPFLAAQAPGALFGVEEAKLTASDAHKHDRFGSAVAIDGSMALIGAQDEGRFHIWEHLGAAYVFEHDGTGWSQQAKLVASVREMWDQFGWSVDISGDTAVVGAPGAFGDKGAVHVFERSGTNWVEQAVLSGSSPIYNGAFGHDVDLEGDTLLVGRPEVDVPSTYIGFPPPFAYPGSVHVFVRTGSTWTEEAILQAGAGQDGDGFGYDVSLSGDRALVGASVGEAVYVFDRSGTSWAESATLAPASLQVSASVGKSVSLEGDLAALGAHGGDGLVHLFSRGALGWSETSVLQPTAALPATKDFSSTVCLEGGRLAVGQAWVGNVTNGSVHVFSPGATGWQERAVMQSSLATPGAGVAYGWYNDSIALSGDRILAGARYDDELHDYAGAAIAFRLCDATPVSYCTAGTSASGCRASLSTSGVASSTQASGFQLLASAVEGGKAGLFFYGSSGRQARPWGNGTSYQCVVPPVSRTPAMAGVGTPGACDGSFALDLNALWHPGGPKAGSNPGVGSLVQAQLWYRDPSTTANGRTNLSDALEFCVGP